VCCAALVGIAAGCGGDSSSSSDVPKDAVAVVGGQPVTKAQFDKAVAQYNRSAKKANQPPIECCSDAWKVAVQQKIMPYLVQRSEFEQQAKKLGVAVTANEIDAEIKKIADQYFKGDMKKFRAAAKQQGSTLDDVKDSIRLNLLQQKVTEKLTSGVKITDKEAHDYYEKNIHNYEKPTSRDLAHILVKTKAKADKLYAQLQNGADFGKLAKKNSTDSGSAVNDGKLGVQAASALVKPFSAVAFKLKTGTISKPVHTQFGWHIIKALGPVIAASTTPFAQEKAAIVQQLKQARDADATSKWQTQMQNYYKGKVDYAKKDYAPPQTTAPAATSLAPTSPTG
jgi:parvulin-like peptidyl-prolyl isomerase